MVTWSFVDDYFVEDEKAVIHVRDLSVQRGYGAFDFLRFEGDQAIFIDDHLERLFRSTRQLNLELNKKKEEIKAICLELIRRNHIREGGIRITVTGGISPDGYHPVHSGLIVTQHSFQLPSKEVFHKGIALMSFEHQRQLPEVKSIDYLMGIQLLPKIKEQDADDVLFHFNGSVTECPRANIFIVNKEGKLLTPAEGILAGITRSKILQLAAEDLKVEETAVSLDEIKNASEVFITSTTKKLLPVASIDGCTIGNGTFPICTLLLSRYEALVK